MKRSILILLSFLAINSLNAMMFKRSGKPVAKINLGIIETAMDLPSAQAIQPQRPSNIQNPKEFLEILIEGSFADAKSILEKGGASAIQPLNFGSVPGGNKYFQDRTPLDIVLFTEPIRERLEKAELLLSQGADRAELDRKLRREIENSYEGKNIEQIRWLLRHGAHVDPIAQDQIQEMEKISRFKKRADQLKQIIAEEKEVPIQLPAVPLIEQQEQDLMWGIKLNDLNQVRAAVAKGASTKDPIKSVLGFKGKKPFEIAYMFEKYPIAEFLLKNGAFDERLLNSYLETAAGGADVNKVDWLLKHGAKDDSNRLGKEAEAEIELIRDASKKQRLAQIIKLLEQAKRKAQSKPKPMPSKGIFEELETKEFLGKVSTVRLLPMMQKAISISAKKQTKAEILEVRKKS